MKKFAIHIILIFIWNASFAQSSKRVTDLGDIAFENGQYTNAIFYYKEVLNRSAEDSKQVDMAYPYEVISYDGRSGKKSRTRKLKDEEKEEIEYDLTDPTVQYLVYQIAEAYRLDFNFEQAEKWFKLSLANDPGEYPNTYFWYGSVLMNNMKYDQAINAFEKFQKDSRDKNSYFHQRSMDLIRGCKFALESIKEYDFQKIVTATSDQLNPGISNFGINFSGNGDKVFFTSSIQEQNSEGEIPLNLEIYSSTKENEKWTSAEKLIGEVNSYMNEGAPTLSPDNRRMFFTRWNQEGKKEIYMSNYFNNKWLLPKKLNKSVNVPGNSAMHPHFSAEDSILYFASDRPGGTGGLDIWYCKIDPFGNAGEAKNLGTTINTAEDEGTPFYHTASGTLYFSSAGHIGMGGLDNFKATGSPEKWAEPENLKYPVNSGRNDAYFSLSKDEEVAYFTSDRNECKDCEMGNCYNNYQSIKNDVIVATGKVYDKLSKQPIPNSLVMLYNVNDANDFVYGITDQTGAYYIVLEPGKVYQQRAQKIKYFNAYNQIKTKGLVNSKNIKFDVYLDLIPKGEIVLEGILYDFGKATLREESMEKLQDLVRILEENPKLVIEIAAHTDSRSSEEFNLELSQQRAESVLNFLVSRGIDPRRLTAVGYGESNPLVPDAEDEFDHQINRRTAFRVISEDFDPDAFPEEELDGE